MTALVESLWQFQVVTTDGTTVRQVVRVVIQGCVTCSNSFHRSVERGPDDSDHGVVDVDEVNMCKTGAAPSLTVERLHC